MHETIQASKRGKQMRWCFYSSLVAVSLSLHATYACSQTSITPSSADYAGLWEAADHRAILEGAVCDDEAHAFCLRIVWIPDPGTDSENRIPEQRSRALCGLEIGRYLRFVSPKWRMGWIYDPNDGRRYDSSLVLRDGRLLLRGFIKAEVFGETETYTRIAKLPAPCGEQGKAKVTQ